MSDIAEQCAEAFNMRLKVLTDWYEKHTGLDLGEQADLVGISRQRLYKMVHFGGTPRFDTVAKISSFYGVSIDWMYGFTIKPGRNE